MANGTTRLGNYVPRHAEPRVRVALKDTRIVAIVGPRQSGKTTLARRIAAANEHSFITLDDAQFRQFAVDDPAGFMRGLETAVIDEIQRAPGLVLEIKKSVDENPRPGRFLITGSVDLFKGAVSPDSLAGRVETIDLLPFSQTEIACTEVSGFLDRAFAANFPGHAMVGPTDDLLDRVLAGGFPEALSRAVPARRTSWLRSYVQALAARDIADIAKVEKPGEMGRLIEHAAVAAGQLLNVSRFAAKLGVDSKTVARWLALLERMFLVRRVRAWHHNELKRLVKAPKLQFLDSGLLAMLRRSNAVAISRDRQQLGPLLECFVYAELVKAAALCDEAPMFSHYRDKDQVEVDLVLESLNGEIVGIEVKAGATARQDHFKGLIRLKSAAGDRFASGILLHDGDRIQQIGHRLFAMPICMLWEK